MSTAPVVSQELQQLQTFAKLFHGVWGAKLNAFRKCPGATRNPSFAEQWPSAPDVVECLRCLKKDHKNTSLLTAHLCELLLAGGAGELVMQLIQLDAILPDQVFRYESGVEFSLLHLACVTGAVEVVRYFKQNEKNNLWTVEDSEGHTPAHVCYSAKIKQFIPALILKRRPYIIPNGNTFENIQSVHALISHPGGFYTFAKHIQCCGLDVNNSTNARGDCLVHTMVRGGFHCLSYLLFLSTRLHADVNMENAKGMTALCVAAQWDQYSLAEVLICLLGADPNAVNSRSQWTPLHYGAATGCQQTVSTLLELGADPMPEDDALCSPERHAATNRHSDMIQQLRHFCSERAELLSEQAKAGMLSTDSLFPSDLSSVNSEGQTLLMVAVTHNHVDLVQKLLKMEGMSKHFKDCKDLKKLQTAVTIASKLNHCLCLEELIRNGCHPALPNAGQKLPLHYACAHRCSVCIRSITSRPEGLTGLKWAHDYLKSDTSKDPVLECIKNAIKRRQLEIVLPALLQAAETGRWGEEEFLEPGDDINITNEHGECPLFVAASHGHLEMVQDMERRGGLVLFSSKRNANTVLHVAARSGSVETVQFVLDYMQQYSTVAQRADPVLFDVNAQNDAGATPLELAALEGHAGVLELLISSGASACVAASNGGLLCCPHYDGIHHKLEYYRKTHTEKVVGLLKWRVKLEDFLQVWQNPHDHNLRTPNGETMLMVAAGNARYEVFHYLMNSLINTPPEMLTREEQPITVRRYDTDSGLADEGQAKYPLQSSTSLSQSQVQLLSSTLLSSTIEPAMQQSDNNPAHSPCQPGSFECHNQSGKHQVALSGYLRIRSSSDGASAAHRAAANNMHRSLALILDVDHTCKDVQDRNGNTPGHLAAMRHHRSSLEVLQKRDADFNICNSEGKYIDELMPQNESYTRKLAAVRRAVQPEALTVSPVVAPSLPSHSFTESLDNMQRRMENLKGVK